MMSTTENPTYRALAICFPLLLATCLSASASGAILNLGDVIDRSSDWEGSTTVANTNWEFLYTFSNSSTAWQTLPGTPMAWDAADSRFENTGAVEFPAITNVAIRTNGQDIGAESFRWGFPDWVSQQPSLTVMANGGILDSQIGPLTNSGAGSQIVVAVYDSSASTWSAKLDSSGSEDQSVAIPIANRIFTLDTNDRIRIAWRAESEHNSAARLVDGALEFTVIGVFTPEPGSLLLAALGTMGILVFRRPRLRQRI